MFSASPHEHAFSPAISLAILLWMLSRTLSFFLYGGAQNYTQYSRWGHINVQHNKRIASFLTQPKNVVCTLGRQGTLLAHAELDVTSTLKSLSVELLSIHSLPRLCLWQALLCPKLRISFKELHAIVDGSNVLKTLCKASHPSRESTAPPSLESSVNL